MKKTLLAALFVALLTPSQFVPARADDLSAAILSRYGNAGGELDEAGMRRLKADLRKARSASRARNLAADATGSTPAKPGHTTYASAPPLTLSAQFAPPNCVPIEKSLFVRADPLDNFHYATDLASAADAKGATLSYTNNRATTTQTANINGRLSFLLVGLQCQQAAGADPTKPYVGSFAIAPFVSSTGAWQQPEGKTTSNSAIKAGADVMLGFMDLGATRTFPYLQRHYLYASPYTQTDYKGLAKINGAVLAWEPYAPVLNLGSYPPPAGNDYYTFFWQLRAEADFVSVRNQGLTNLADSRYVWTGATVRGNVGLFPLARDSTWPDWVAGRMSLIGTANYYYNAIGRGEARNYSAAVQYKLGPCKKDPEEKDKSAPCKIQGSTSLSLEYNWGTDKDTLVTAKQYVVKLGYAF